MFWRGCNQKFHLNSFSDGEGYQSWSAKSYQSRRTLSLITTSLVRLPSPEHRDISRLPHLTINRPCHQYQYAPPFPDPTLFRLLTSSRLCSSSLEVPTPESLHSLPKSSSPSPMSSPSSSSSASGSRATTPRGVVASHRACPPT